MPFENRNHIFQLKMKDVGVYAKYQKCETNESKHYPIRNIYYMFIFKASLTIRHTATISQKKWDFKKKSMGLPNFKGRKSGLPEFES